MMEADFFPPGFQETAQTRWGDLAEVRLAALASPSVKSIRCHPGKPISIEKWSETPVPWCENGFYVPEDTRFITDPAWHAGAYYVQEASSMVLAEVFKQLGPFERALDVSAAPGGKSTLLLDYLAPQGVLVSNEPEPTRSHILVENLMRRGDFRVVATRQWPKFFAEHAKGLFDLVLVDAPCSGEGMFRKEPAARKQWKPGLLEQCMRTQSSILPEVIQTVAPGGYLIYSTCTFHSGENEDMVASFLPEAGFSPVPIALPEAWGFVQDGRGLGWYAYPERVKGEGFYFSVWQNDGLTHGPKAPKSVRKGQPDCDWSDWLRGLDVFPGTSSDRQVILGSEGIWQMQGWWEKWRPVMVGVMPGEKKGKQCIPAHGLALVPGLQPEKVFEVSEEEALDYLRGQPLAPHASWETGYGLVQWEGLGLGWLNHLGVRTNNYLPKTWRILHY
jgi:16S rRNA C967 or C1407 C5-methylase (RsmB/RsmF family)